MADMQKMLDALKDKICFVTYQKIDTGELREMECTLNPDYIPNNYVLNQRLGSDIVVWCLDKSDWRAFRVNTVKDWRVKT
jgi:hypothetical protein